SSLPDRCEIRRAARRAPLRHGLAMAAVMAAKLVRLAMEHEVRAAPPAGRMPRAGPAEKHGGEAAPVHEDEGLLAPRDAFPERLHEREGEPFVGAIGPRIDRAHRRHG